MALLKKKKDKPAAPISAAGDAPAPAKGGKLLAILAPIFVFGASFGGSYILGGAPAPAPTPVEAEAPTAATHSAEWNPTKPEKTVALNTMTLSAGPQGQTLRIGIAIEVWDADAEIADVQMRDAFTTYFRALDPSQLADPSFHVRMKRALLHRARVVAGQDVVADVLITDFLLTS